MTSRFAGMDRTIAQIRCDVSEVRQEVSRMSAVLDEHDRMIADICWRLGMVPRITGLRAGTAISSRQ